LALNRAEGALFPLSHRLFTPASLVGWLEYFRHDYPEQSMICVVILHSGPAPLIFYMAAFDTILGVCAKNSTWRFYF